DRHIAAFIGARANFDVERQMSDLTLPDPERAAMAMLNLLAVIQWRLGQGGLQGLATWVGGLMQPSVNSFHNRERRKLIEKEIPRIARDGNLVELARLLDSPEERTKDAHEFTEARTEWLAAQREIANIEEGRSNNEKALRFAQQLAALVSVTISLITVVLLLLARLL
ncbi:MAG TPA: protein kinase family protein, partial [Telmatospirillum sp.]|nr:protein kinase family protein [Telmatospirillum sp.]